MSAEAVDPAGPPPMTTTSGLRSLMVQTRTDSHLSRTARNHEITKFHRGILFVSSCFRGLRFVFCVPNSPMLRHEEIREQRIDAEQTLARQADQIRRRLGDVAARLPCVQLGAEAAEQIDA